MLRLLPRPEEARGFGASRQAKPRPPGDALRCLIPPSSAEIRVGQLPRASASVSRLMRDNPGRTEVGSGRDGVGGTSGVGGTRRQSTARATWRVRQRTISRRRVTRALRPAIGRSHRVTGSPGCRVAAAEPHQDDAPRGVVCLAVPQGWSRWRTTVPDDAAIGGTPHMAENADSFRISAESLC